MLAILNYIHGVIYLILLLCTLKVCGEREMDVKVTHDVELNSLQAHNSKGKFFIQRNTRKDCNFLRQYKLHN